MNTPGRVPSHIPGLGAVTPDGDACLPAPSRRAGFAPADKAGGQKLLADIGAAFDACGVRDGATLSFHHHLRNGDAVLNPVPAEAARRGLRDLTIAPSSLFPVHAPLVEQLNSGVVGRIVTAWLSGPAADAVSRGVLPVAVRMPRTAGGRGPSSAGNW